MQMQRLSGRKVCERVLRRGIVWRGKTFIARYMFGFPANERKPGVYVGTFASSALEKSAVKRNRMRRRMREAMRIALAKNANLETVQLLLSPQRSSFSCGFSDIEADVARFLNTLKRS